MGSGSPSTTGVVTSARDPFDGHWHAYVDGKSYGPYTGHHIRSMVAAGEILDTDLVCNEGASSWGQAKDDPVLRLLFLKSAISDKPKRGPTAKRGRRINALAGVIILFVCGWFAWPYLSLFQLSMAVRDGDVTALENRINWESVRQGLRADLNLLFLKNSAKEQNEFGKGLAVLFGPALINQMVDGYVTPQAIGSLIRGGKPDLATAPASPPPNTRNGIELRQLKYAFFDRGPFSFRVDVQPANAKQNKGLVTLIFAWSGDWKVTRLVLPLEDFQEFADRPSKTESAAKFVPAPLSSETRRPQSTPKADNAGVWGSMFKQQVERCWKKPYGGIELQKPEAAFAVRLKRDGMLEGMPVPEGTSGTPYLRVYQESALRAIIECQPYKLPPAFFEEWKYFAPVFTETR